MEAATTTATETCEAYCPHCFLLVESDARGPWPPQPTRCQHCKLMIGPGRARPTPDAAPGARGTAAGVFAQAAREARNDGDADVSPDRVRDAIREVAESTGARPERLLMVDQGTSLPAIAAKLEARATRVRRHHLSAPTRRGRAS